MSEVDDAIASARSAWARISAEQAGAPIDGYDPRARARATQAIGRRLTRIAVADVAILVAAFVIGLVVPLGLFGALAVMALLVAATVLFAVWPAEDRAPPPERLRTLDLKALPQQTGRWLDAQRPALPAPARTLVDQIGVRLETLRPQLAALEADAPAAAELRKLVGEQLPEFVRGYQKVPDALRGVPRNGKTPDAELVDGLTLIEQEIGQMSQTLAESDLDSLATRGRFLEIKYRGDPPG